MRERNRGRNGNEEKIVLEGTRERGQLRRLSPSSYSPVVKALSNEL